MPPIIAAKKISTPSSNYRRSKRISDMFKSTTKEQSKSLKGQSTSSKRRGQSASLKTQSTSSKGQSKSPKEQSTSSKGQSTSSKGQSTSSKGKSAPSKGQPTSSKEKSKSSKGQSSANENPKKRRRVMQMDEINKRASRMVLKENQDFSSAIVKILKELSPKLEISEEALSDMNTYLNYVFERLARQAAIIPLGRNSNCITIKDIETAIPYIIEGNLCKFCVLEGRTAVKKWDEVKYLEAYQQ